MSYDKKHNPSANIQTERDDLILRTFATKLTLNSHKSSLESKVTLRFVDKIKT